MQSTGDEVCFSSLSTKKNNITLALILLAIAFVSGILIVNAYLKYVDNLDFRPPLERRLHKNLELLSDSGEIITISDLDGKLWLTFQTCAADGEKNETAHRIVEAARKRFPETQIYSCIFLVDTTPEELEQLKSYRKSVDTLTENDFIVAAEVPLVQKYLKNEFRYGLLPYEKEGKWIYDSSIIAMGNDRHRRGLFDFEKAAAQDQKIIQNNGVPKSLSELETNFARTIDYLIKNPDESK